MWVCVEKSHLGKCNNHHYAIVILVMLSCTRVFAQKYEYTENLDRLLLVMVLVLMLVLFSPAIFLGAVATRWLVLATRALFGYWFVLCGRTS